MKEEPECHIPPSSSAVPSNSRKSRRIGHPWIKPIDSILKDVKTPVNKEAELKILKRETILSKFKTITTNKTIFFFARIWLKMIFDAKLKAHSELLCQYFNFCRKASLRALRFASHSHLPRNFPWTIFC